MRAAHLEINQDLDVQRKMWILQRIGWGGMATLILAALVGVFGSGPVARTVMTDGRQLFRLEYDRFGSYEGKLVLRLELAAESTYRQYVALWIDKTYWVDQAIEHIVPEPVASRVHS